MPRLAMDYSKTNIYKIVCNDLSIKDCYVGHTTDMTKRKWTHKTVCNSEKNKKHNLKIYKIIRENGGWDNWNMVLVEEFPCKDKYEACKRERELYEELDAKLNTYRPYLTHEERKQYYQEHNLEYDPLRKDLINLFESASFQLEGIKFRDLFSDSDIPKKEIWNIQGNSFSFNSMDDNSTKRYFR